MVEALGERQEDYVFVTCPERISEGQRKTEELLSDVDQEKLDKFIDDQVALVGSRLIFSRIDNNMKTGVIEYSLLKELSDLYLWRRQFFDENLPVLRGSWFTDSYCRDVITFQVIKNFDFVLKLVCSRKLNAGEFPRGIFLKSDQDKTRIERYRIDNIEFLYHHLDLRKKILWTGYFLSRNFIPGSYLRYNDIATILMEKHSKGPQNLQQLALRVIKRSQFNLDEAPIKKVLLNDTVGFYNIGEMPPNLTDDGSELFLKLNEVFNELSKCS